MKLRFFILQCLSFDLLPCQLSLQLSNALSDAVIVVLHEGLFRIRADLSLDVLPLLDHTPQLLLIRGLLLHCKLHFLVLLGLVAVLGFDLSDLLLKLLDIVVRLLHNGLIVRKVATESVHLGLAVVGFAPHRLDLFSDSI